MKNSRGRGTPRPYLLAVTAKDKVRQLSSVSDTDLQVDYTYDDAGIRTSKTVNGVTTHYNTKDGVILAQSDGSNTLYFQYDTNGSPFAFVWNDSQYFYVTTSPTKWAT